MTPVTLPVSPEIVFIRMPRFISSISGQSTSILLTILRILDFGALESHGFDGIVRPATNRSNGKAMTTGADTSSENNILCNLSRAPEDIFISYRAAINGYTVVLIIDVCTTNGNTSTGTDVKSIRICAQRVGV